jgi:hypothetical protein
MIIIRFFTQDDEFWSSKESYQLELQIGRKKWLNDKISNEDEFQ